MNICDEEVCIFSGWVNVIYLKEEDADIRENLKSLAMGGGSGLAWAKIYLNRQICNTRINGYFYDLLKEELNVLFKKIVIQIGSSSGRELAYLYKSYPQHTYIGTDIYTEVIDFANNYYKGNILFIECPAHKIGDLMRGYKHIEFIVFSSGSLQYVQPEHLKIFFKQLSGFKVYLVLFEPVEQRILNSAESPIIYRGNFSYSHHYVRYAELNGFKTLVTEYQPDNDVMGNILYAAKIKW